MPCRPIVAALVMLLCVAALAQETRTASRPAHDPRADDPDRGPQRERSESWGGGSPEAAIAAARAAVEETDRERGAGSQAAAAARRLLGQRLALAGRLEEAVAADREALAILEQLPAAKPSHLVNTRIEVVALLYRLNRIDEAVPIARLAAQGAEEAAGLDGPRRAKILYVVAAIEYETGELERAEGRLRTALALLRSSPTKSPADLVSVLQSLGGVLTNLGGLAEARICLAEAAAIAEADAAIPREVAAAGQGMLGSLEDNLGRRGEARAHFEKQLALLETPGAEPPEEVAVVLANIGSMLLGEGQLDRARQTFDRALTACEATKTRRRLAYILNEYAYLETSQGDPVKGEALAIRAVAAARASKGRDPEILARVLRVLATAKLANGKGAEALGAADEAIALQQGASAQPRSLANAFDDRGRALTGLERKAEARASFDEALKFARIWLATSTGSLSESERLGSLWPVRSIMDVWLSVALGDPGSAPVVADEVLAWQGQVLRAVHTERAWLRAHADAEVLALRSRLARISDDLAPRQLALRAFPQQPHATEVAERERIERELAARVGRDAGRAPKAGALTDALAADEALVDYFVYTRRDPAATPTRSRREERLCAVVLRRGRPPEALDLGPLDVVRDAASAHLSLVARLVAPDPAAEPLVAAAAAAARKAVWDPVAAKVAGAARVFVVPDSFLAALPFETLPSGAAAGRYLIEDFEFVYLQVAEDLARRPAGPAGKGALLAGGVDFGVAPDEGAAARLARAALGIPLAPLPRSGDEIAGVARVLASGGKDAEVVALSGKAATEAAVRDAVAGKRFVHLATHGIFVAEPAGGARMPDSRVSFKSSTALEGFVPFTRAAVALAGANEAGGAGKDDGLLTAGEAAWLDLGSCELVVLSGCESGLGAARSGESLIGLRRAFHLAGARSTVTALWRVGDQGCADLMIAFYERLLAGRGKSAALREARLAILERNRARHGGLGLPGAWGAFVIDGDWR